MPRRSVRLAPSGLSATVLYERIGVHFVGCGICDHVWNPRVDENGFKKVQGVKRSRKQKTSWDG